MDARPPRARKVPHVFEAHGHVRQDDYYWLRERDDAAVLAHLEAENAYTEKVLEHVRPSADALYDEIIARLDPTDISVPYRLDDYYYYRRFEAGAEYPIHCRKRGSLDAGEEVMLDGPRMAEGHSFFAIGGMAISWRQDVLAYALDTVGRRIYTIRFRDLGTGRDLDDELVNASGAVAWAADNRTLFYVQQDLETLRPYRIMRHRLGTDPNDDELVYEETDPTYWAGIGRTKSKRYLLIMLAHKVRTEMRFLPSDEPDGTFRVFLPREGEHEYQIDHYGEHFYILSNHEARNFRLLRTPIDDTARGSWEELVPHREDVLLQDMELFEQHLVLEERKEGLVGLRIRRWDDGDEHYVSFDEPTYAVSLSTNPSFDSQLLRFDYDSLTTPPSVYDYDMRARERTLLKRQRVVGIFRSEDYVAERLQARAADGERIPISLVYRRGFEKNGTRPLLLYGYGSYGISIDAAFGSHRLSLLDRGFVYAIAHIRGGEEMGRRWYEQGKMMHKKNTFTDFIAAAEHLLAERYTAPDRIFAMGGSAGGLLIGAVINERPDLFAGVLAAVPFVDVLTTMLDDSIPLTTAEYDEWGNPNEPAAYEYMRSYSPYDNIDAKPYPHVLATTGLHDSQVQYWEPAKWVAKLRDQTTADRRILLHTNLDAGHGGASGRYRRYREIAMQYAFLLDLAGIRG